MIYLFRNVSKKVHEIEKQLLQEKEKLEKEEEHTEKELTQNQRAWRKIKSFSLKKLFK